MAENHQEIAGYIGRLMRDSLGRGPKSVWVSLGPSFVVIYLQGLMSPLEEILLEEQQQQVVVTTRETWMKRILPDIKATVQLMTSLSFDSIYYDWGLQNRSGIIVGVKDTYPDSGAESSARCQALLHEITEVSAQVQKTPDKTMAYELDERTIVVLREGILVSIEKEFIRLGQAVTLKYAKRTLEKRFLHNNTNFEHILRRHVLDIFVDWDFEQDKSVIVFKLK